MKNGEANDRNSHDWDSGDISPLSRRSVLRTVDVLVPIQSAGPYTYTVPETLALADEVLCGRIVRVPFGRRQILGIVVGPSQAVLLGSGGRKSPPLETLKPLIACLEAPPFSDDFLNFLIWVSQYSCTPLGILLKTALGPLLSHRQRLVVAYRLSGKEKESKSLSPERRRVVAALSDGALSPASIVAENAGVSKELIRRMAADGFLIREQIQPEKMKSYRHQESQWPDPDLPGPQLSQEQAGLAERLRSAQSFGVYLLDGVTGSGKTEVYFEAIVAAVRYRRQSLVMMPEIALTTGWLDRFARRFNGVRPVVWHSSLTPAARRQAWQAIGSGQAGVVVGARSALFLPFHDLGLIIVDEEHDPGYKQEEGMIYHARDMAVVRARECDVPIVLASATPSLESHINAQTGRYQRLTLTQRYGDAHPPKIEAIDLRIAPPPSDSWLSPVLVEEIGAALARREQVLLFLNRRGFAPLTLCRCCGHRLHCSDCSVCLVRRRDDRLLCHHCGKEERLPTLCPACQVEDKWASCGPGIERIEKEVEHLFPDARRLLLSSDSLHQSVGATRDILHHIASHGADILIGTQIVAKGHHFPHLTLVGVVDADLGLDNGDLRSAEHTYQLLNQVAGRAGRESLPGRAFLQTYCPDHPVIQALLSGDRDGFLSAETRARRNLDLPPFGRLAALVISGTDSQKVEAHAHALAVSSPTWRGVKIFGPAPAPLARLRRRYRWRLLAQAARGIDLSAFMRDWLAIHPSPSGVTVRIDIDPHTFL